MSATAKPATLPIAPTNPKSRRPSKRQRPSAANPAAVVNAVAATGGPSKRNVSRKTSPVVSRARCKRNIPSSTVMPKRTGNTSASYACKGIPQIRTRTSTAAISAATTNAAITTSRTRRKDMDKAMITKMPATIPVFGKSWARLLRNAPSSREYPVSIASESAFLIACSTRSVAPGTSRGRTYTATNSSPSSLPR